MIAFAGEPATDNAPNGPDLTGLDGAFSQDGYVDVNDMQSWNWQLSDSSLGNPCDLPLCQSFMSAPTGAGPANYSASGGTGAGGSLLIGGNQNASGGGPSMDDGLFGFDGQMTYSPSAFTPVASRANGRLTCDAQGRVYQVNTQIGLVRLNDGQAVVTPGGLTTSDDPRYHDNASVFIGLQKSGSDCAGRPIRDAAVDAWGYVYVAPVVVVPALGPSAAYLAAAKLQLHPGQTPCYSLVRLYDDPPGTNDNQDPFRLGLREIEVDAEGNVFALSAYRENASDFLWAYPAAGGTPARLALDNISGVTGGIVDPIALCASKTSSVIYLASGQNTPEAESTTVYALSTDNLSLAIARTIAISGMGHVTAITEDPASGLIWVAGFRMQNIPAHASSTDPPYYHPCLACVSADNNSVQATQLDAGALALPMAAVWIPSPVTVQGTVVPGDYSEDLTRINIGFRFQAVSGGDPITRAVFLNADGTFALTNIPPGIYDITISGDCWLQRELSEVVISANPTAVGTIILTPSVVTVPFVACASGRAGSGKACDSRTPALGTPTNGLGSLQFQIDLGEGSDGKSVGYLYLHEDQPSSALATPATLRWAVADTISVQTVNGVFDNVTVPQGQVKVDTQASGTYYFLKIYRTGETTPCRTYKVENPSGSAAQYNSLWITETPGNGVTKYEWDNTTGTWELVAGDGLRTETLTKAWDNQTGVRTETHTVYDNSTGVSHLAYQEISTYKVFPWGENLIQRQVGAGSDNQTTAWRYYGDNDTIASDHPKYGRLKQEIQNGGYTLNYDYTYEGGQLTQTTRSDGTRTTETTYAHSDLNNDGHADSAVTTVEKIDNQEISRRQKIFWSFTGTQREVSDIQYYRANGVLTGLETRTRSYEGTGDYKDHRPLRITKPDGTMSLYGYPDDNTTIVSTGQPATDNSTVVDGVTTVSITDAFGNPVSTTTRDIATDVVLSSDNYSQPDAGGRPQRVDHADGTYSITHYRNGGGIDDTTDREGILTTYTYDALNRVVAATRAGVTTSYTYDGLDHVLTEARNGTTIKTHTYDTAGRRTSTTDGLNHTTTYTYALDGDGRASKTTTWPDNTTQTETRLLDDRLVSLTGTAVHPVFYEYGSQDNLSYTRQIKGDNATGAEWTKTYSDLAGRTVKVLYPNPIDGLPIDVAYSELFYNDKGQLIKQADPDKVTTLYGYNGKGELEYTAIDINRNGQIDVGSMDRITHTVRQVVNAHGTTVQRTITNVYTTDNQTDTYTTRIQDTSTDGLRSWSTVNGLTTVTEIAHDSANQARTILVTNPDNTTQETRYENGREVWTIRKDTGGVQIEKTQYTYDTAGRVVTETHIAGTASPSRTTTYNGYDQNDRPLSVTVSTTGIEAQTTTYEYDAMGRTVGITYPDNLTVHSQYTGTGELAKTWGARTYPAEYGYDYAGRMVTMKTWKDFDNDTDSAVTTWTYNPRRGWLTRKQYADGQHVDFGYSPAGRLWNRTWARGTKTYYNYNKAGELYKINYADNTPDVTYTLDRLGRKVAISDAGGSRTLTHTAAGQLESETLHDGVFDNISISHTYDLNRRTGVRTVVDYEVIESGLPGLEAVTAVMDATANDGNWNAAADLDGDGEITSTDLSQAINQLVITKIHVEPTSVYGYDNAARLASVSQRDPVDNATFRQIRYGYLDNPLWPDNVTFLQDNITKMVTTTLYDGLDRLIAIDNVPAGDNKTVSFAYGYNAVNQRTGMINQDNLTWQYSYDLLGQLSQARFIFPSEVDQFVLRYDHDSIGNRKRIQVGFEPDRFATWDYTGNSVNQYTSCGHDNTTDTFAYDADGNLTQDGDWNYGWDGENRLVELESRQTRGANLPIRKLAFVYDDEGRRVIKTVQDLNGDNTTYTTSLYRRFLYDGGNLVAELNDKAQPVRTFVWGLDLSGRGQGAAEGRDALLLVRNWNSSDNVTCFAAYDGTGNVRRMVRTDNGTSDTYFGYDPFGKTFTHNDNPATPDPFGYSTQYYDNETKLYYCGNRYYSPAMGRWLNRNPNEEKGAANVYASTPR